MMVPMREGVPYQLTTGQWVVMNELGIFPYPAPQAVNSVKGSAVTDRPVEAGPENHVPDSRGVKHG